MSQNGLKKYESGHGSRGIGALVTAGLGDPGEKGECMSLSKRCIPPLGSPSTLNVGTLGVTIGSSVALLCLRPVMENVWLRGVPIDPSEPSGLDIDRVRCFKLRDDLFFLMPIAEVLPFLGDPGTRPVSMDTA
jgi:hypothetical protein